MSQVGCLYGNQRPKAESLVEEWKAGSCAAVRNGDGEDDDGDRDWNRGVLRRVGTRLAAGVNALYQEDYDAVLDNMVPIR